MSNPDISIVLPVHNQADHLERVINDYQAALKAIPVSIELVLVLNACRDESPAAARGLAAADDRIRVVETPEGGWGLAVKLGLREAAGNLICYTNLARTAGADLASMLQQALGSEATVLKARRVQRERLSRRLGSSLYNLECRLLFGLPWHDVNGTPKVFPRRYHKLLELRSDDDLIDAEFSAVCRREDYPLVEVPIYSSRRHGGKSTTSLRSAARMYGGAIRLWRQLKRKG